MAYAAVKERSAGVELEAHRRAQNVLDEAKLQARRVRQQTHQWLNQMVQEYNTLRRQLDAALTSAGKQLDQVGQTLSKQDGAFDQLREAYAKTDPDRAPPSGTTTPSASSSTRPSTSPRARYPTTRNS